MTANSNCDRRQLINFTRLMNFANLIKCTELVKCVSTAGCIRLGLRRVVLGSTFVRMMRMIGVCGEG